MMYNVRVDHIAEDIPDIVLEHILEYLQTYRFQYVRSIRNKEKLRDIFIQYFKERHDYEWLKSQVYYLARIEGRKLQGVAAVAFTEPNRIHTMVLGEMLLSKDISHCRTTHTYGREPMSNACRINLENKTLDIQEVLANTCPLKYSDLKRRDRCMIPQHVNCRHVMVPPDDVDIEELFSE